MMAICKTRAVLLAAIAAAAMAAPALAQEGSDPLVPSQPPIMAQPARPPTPTAPQTVPSPPPKPAAVPLAKAPTTHQATGSIARQAAIERSPARLALAVSDVNLRSAPGTGSEKITTIPGGSTVHISGCTGEWCAVSWQGHRGFAIAHAFDSGTTRQARNYRSAPYEVEDDVVEAGPRVVYEDAPVVVYEPRYYYGPLYYGWHRRW